MKGIFHFLFRLVFGLALVGLGLHGLSNINTSAERADKTVDLIREHYFFKQPSFAPILKEHSKTLVVAHYYLFVVAGAFSILGLGLAKLLTFLAVLGNLALIHNVYFYNDEKTLVTAMKYVALLGGSLNL